MMNRLAACLKKEWLELCRTKKWIFYLLFAFGMVLFALAVVLVMDFVGENFAEGGEFSEVFSSKNLAGMTRFFLAYLMTYYMIFVIVMQMGSSSREIRKRLWLLPLSSGVKRSDIVLAKFIVLGLAALLPAAAAFLVSTLVGGFAFGNAGAAAVTAGELFTLGLCAAATVVQFSVLTVALSAITGSTGVTAAISGGLYLFGGLILGLFENFVYYTPFLFQTVAMGGSAPALTAAQWISAALTTVLLLALLIYFAMYRGQRKNGKVLKK